ncbi:putative transmembrane protein [Trichinella pseudospiralis]|uniref:Uncharacterized protein n=1 Tax=Trichinella pseudospiralis TaxID=6337 RepID=A0A0V1G6D8_TRIPS|nr:hypothetical protein T4D_4390 [Trichinella pseudospiralis]
MQQHPAAIGEKAAGMAGLLAARIQGHLMQTGRNIQSILITIVTSGLAKVNRVVVVVGACRILQIEKAQPPAIEAPSSSFLMFTFLLQTKPTGIFILILDCSQ